MDAGPSGIVVEQVERFCSPAQLATPPPILTGGCLSEGQYFVYSNSMHVVLVHLLAWRGPSACSTERPHLVITHPAWIPPWRCLCLGHKTLTDNGHVTRMKTLSSYLSLKRFLSALSAYSSKCEPLLSDMGLGFPTTPSSRRTVHWNTRPAWFTVSFLDFVQHVSDTTNLVLNPHLKPATDACHPCWLCNDVYGNFKFCKQDVWAGSHWLGIKPKLFSRVRPAQMRQMCLIAITVDCLDLHQKEYLLILDFKDEYDTLYPRDDSCNCSPVEPTPPHSGT